MIDLQEDHPDGQPEHEGVHHIVEEELGDVACEGAGGEGVEEVHRTEEIVSISRVVAWSIFS